MRCLSDDALELLRAGATAITQRPWLTQVIMRQFLEQQSAEGLGMWRRPRVLSLHAWLTALWKERRYTDRETPVLLTAQQETFLWQQIIEGDREDREGSATLLEVGATARQARSTAIACAEYEIPLNDPRWKQDHDPSQFAVWLKQLNQLCGQEGWITLARWWRLAPERIRSESHHGEQLLLAGFESPSPALRRLTKAWSDAGGNVIHAKALGARAQLTKIPVASQEAEWEQPARWARRLVEANETSVGVFMPDLDANHAPARRVFDDVFTPGHLAAAVSGQAEGAAGDSEPVHVGMAFPLREHPLIAAAFLVLETVAQRIPSPSASALLRSPYLAGAPTERMVRAQADVYMRRSRELEVSLESLQRAARSAPKAQRLFHDVKAFLKGRPESADFAQWAHFIADLLKLAGWPGDTDLSLSERAIVEEWKDALSTLASLSLVSTTVKWPEAFRQLRRLLATQQPHRGDAGAPVQVMDVREAASIHFDHVWVTGLSPEHWNWRFDSFPLIPRALQVETKMPHATHALRRQRERHTLDGLIRSGRDVLVSYVKEPIPLLKSTIEESPDFKLVSETLPRDALWAGTLWSRSFLISPEIEKLTDSEAPLAKNSKPSGGTRIIKSQSECPFRAFAEFRLNALKPDEGTFGFDAMERGQFLHTVLEFVWKQIRTQDRLKELSGSELDPLVREAIASATKTSDEESEFHRELTEVERLRLKSLVLDWLDVEKQRLMPFVVEEVEQGRTFEIEGVTIKLRIDRVDRLENGKLLLIDYKSGEQDFGKLEGERPSEPQLLVYAAATGDTVDGVLLGQVRRGSLALAGITRDAQANVQANSRKLKAVGSGWPRQQREWNETVRRLARNFRHGEAAVDPTPQACAFCQIKPLCRIQEIRESAAAGGEDEGDE